VGPRRIEGAFTRRQCVARRSRSSYIRIRNSADDEQSNRLQSLLHFAERDFPCCVSIFAASAIARRLRSWSGELSDAAAASTGAGFQSEARSAGSPESVWRLDRMQLLMRRPEIEGFVAIAPANRFDFLFSRPVLPLSFRAWRSGSRRPEGSHRPYREAQDPEGIAIEHAVIPRQSFLRELHRD